jgi:hypothetical protein
MSVSTVAAAKTKDRAILQRRDVARLLELELVVFMFASPI